MKLHKPPHPGETLRDDVLPVLGETRAAQSAPLRQKIARIKPAVRARAEGAP